MERAMQSVQNFASTGSGNMILMIENIRKGNDNQRYFKSYYSQM